MADPDSSTLKRCPKCGITKAPDQFGRDKSRPDGLKCWCLECKRAAGRVYAALNLAQNTERFKEWRQANPDRMRQLRRNHYWRHRERLLAEQAEERRTDGDRIRALDRAYYARNRERTADRRRANARRRWALHKHRIKLYQRAYYKANSAIFKQARDRYMARRKAAPGRYTQVDVNEILAAQKSRCAYCRKKLTKAECEVDHINSLNKGGTNFRRNIQITCRSCNSKKRDKDPLDFARELGRLL